MNLQSIQDDFTIFIKSNPAIYKSYLRIKGKYIPNLFPSSSTSICLEGYSRSGNTFSLNLVRRLFPDVNIASHVHTVSSIKLAFKNNVPVIVLIRDPKDCIPSGTIKKCPFTSSFSKDIPLRLLREYIHYYQYVLKNIDKLKIIEFKRLISDCIILVNHVCESLGRKLISRDDILIAEKAVTDKLKSDTRPTALNKWYSPQKEKMKSEVVKIIETKPEYINARKIYRKLKKYSQ